MATVKPSHSIHFFNDALNVIKINGSTITKLLEIEEYNKPMVLKLLQTANELFLVLTNSYPPKPYYTLFSEIQLYIQPLQMYLIDYERKFHDLQDIYELCQYVPMCLPRLYLMVTVASAMSLHNHKYPSPSQVPDTLIIHEVMSMSKAVQHSIRGLFLRHYLSISFKHTLDSSDGLDLSDKVQFIINNLVQMVTLWIRWQHHGYAQDVRQDERQQLTTLIGIHFQRLTQLEFSVDYYSASVLPMLLQEIISTEDDLAQEYLLQVIMDGFPINFQLATLNQVLACVAKCQINIKRTMLTMLSTFTSRYTVSDANATDQINLFSIFFPQVQTVLVKRPDVLPIDVSEIIIAMVRLVITCYPNNHEYINSILESLSKYLSNNKQMDIQVWDNFLDVLKLLLVEFNYTIFYHLQGLDELTSIFPIRHQMEIAQLYIDALLAKHGIISTNEQLSTFLTMTKSLYNSRPELPISETISFCKALHQIKHEDANTELMLISNVRKRIAVDSSHNRIKVIVPTLVNRCLTLLRKGDAAMGNVTFKFIHQLIALLVHHTNELQQRFGKIEDEDELQCLKLYLECGVASSHYKMEEMAYELFVQGFTVYETMISESRSQYAALLAIIYQLCKSELNGDNYDILTTKLCLYANKLLKRQDQCRCILLSTHLFMKNKNFVKLLEMLQKSIKIADACIDQQSHLELFVEILSKYIYFKLKGVETITVKHVNVLIGLISTNIKEQIDVSNMQQRQQQTIISPLLLGNSLYGAPLSVQLPSAIANSEMSGMDKFAQWMMITKHFKNLLKSIEQEKELEGVVVAGALVGVEQVLLLLQSKISK